MAATDHLVNENSVKRWPGEHTQFQTTLWMTVVAAGQTASHESEAALATLCQIYWRPVYAFIRRRKPTADDARDATQGFFAQFLEKNHVARADSSRGRFRSFLMTSVEHFLCDEHDRATSQKRGGGRVPLSLESAGAEENWEPAESMTPVLAFEKEWAKSLLGRVMDRLAEYGHGAGRKEVFEHLRAYLWGEVDSIPYAEISALSGMSTANLRVLAHRMRQRYRELLYEEIAQTVAGREEIEGEIRYLLQVVSI